MIVTKDEVANDLLHYARVLRDKVFIYPTDTIYGIGCDATNARLVARIRSLKKRSKAPFSVIAPSKEWIAENCYIPKEASEWMDRLPGPYTLIARLLNKGSVASIVNPGVSTLGVRIPDSWFAKVVSAMAKPVVTTSVNKTGERFMTCIDDLDGEIMKGVDIIISEGVKAGRPSTLIDLSSEKITVTERK